jgi:hypothetical protein
MDSHRVSNREHRQLEDGPESPSWWAPVVTIDLWLMWDAFGQRGLVAGSRSQGWAWGMRGKADVSRQRRGETRGRWDKAKQIGTQQTGWYSLSSYVHAERYIKSGP